MTTRTTTSQSIRAAHRRAARRWAGASRIFVERTEPGSSHPVGATTESGPRASPGVSEIDLRTAQHVHLVGIGGSGMSALAMLLLQMGRRVSGSDVAASTTAERL